MKKHLLLLMGALIALPALARDFTYTYEGQTITYTVINEEAKTCKTKDGERDNPGNLVSGKLILPSNPKDGETEFKLSQIGKYAFFGCGELTSVTIPNSVKSIGWWAFSGCIGLTSIVIPTSATMIFPGVFAECSGLTSVTIPNSVKTIGSDAFRGCSGLTSVTIPNSVTYIGSNAFSACSSLTSVTIPNSVTEIPYEAFAYCSGLTSVSIPSSVTKIGNGAFYGSGLRSVVIPNSVTEIRWSAFEGCSGLTSVTIPNSVTYIGRGAFFGCSALTSVTYLAEEPIKCKPDFAAEVYENATLNYLKSAEEKIAATEPWSKFKNRIGRDADFKDDSSISEVRNAEAGTTAVYDMRGVKVGESTEGLPKGIYIVRQGSTTRKIAI